MLRRFLCWFGIHDWFLAYTDDDAPDEDGVNNDMWACKKCKQLRDEDLW